MENTKVENIKLNNPGRQEYAPCGCSQMVFNIIRGIYGEFEVKYWLGVNPEHNHRFDKVRTKLIS